MMLRKSLPLTILDLTGLDLIILVRVVSQDTLRVMGLTPYTQKAILFMALFLYIVWGLTMAGED